MTNLVHTYDTSRYTANTKMYSGILPYLPYEDRLCTKCSSADIGDEFHYVFSYPVFAESNKKQKNSPFYCKNANVNRFHSLFCSKKKRLLVNLAHFLKFILSEF